MNFHQKNILVLGLARSGFSAAKLLASQGGKVTAVDIKEEAQLKVNVNELRALKVEIFTQDNSLKRLEGKDFLVISPGIPLEHPLIRKAQGKGIKLLGELELASHFCSSPIIAVTGTNGKSTTCSLIGHILEAAGISHKVAGNIGIPFSSVVPLKDEVAVVEVSSYQLETVNAFKPHIAVWLNLTPDHLGRHKTMEEYTSAKTRIFKRQTKDDFMIFNADDRLVTNSCAKAPSCLFPFSYQGTKGIFVKGDKIAFNWKGEEGAILPLNELRIRGRHNLENAFAASAAAIAFQVDPKAITRALETFTGIEHRQEFVAQFKGVTFINDSKATNLDSGLKALETIASPIILIAGGRGKGESYIPARPLIKEKVKFLITLGETAEQLSEELSDAVKTLYAQDMKEAVALAWKNAVAGDHILLSPMCASFDMFQDFEERGRVFKSFVMELTGGDR